ncbi:MAG: LacI family DNA-binding transcriptional regulator [Microbacteriaceae bacterium]
MSESTDAPRDTTDPAVALEQEARPTSYDVPRLAGVSVSAVSLALNGRPGLGDSTRQRILDVAAELNWRPHRAARALKGAISDVAGLVIARPARTLGVEPFFAHLLSGLQSRLSHDAIALQLLIVEDTAAEIETYRRWAAERRVGGVVLLDLAVDDPRPDAVSELGIPAVAVGGFGTLRGITNVWADDFGAMSSLVSYLVALGHRRIGHISGTPSFEHTHRRMEAIGALADDFGLDITSISTDYSDQQGADATRSLLASRNRPSALVYDSDVMAVAGLGVAMEMGVAVPSSLSIASFDDSVLTQLTHPAITSLTRDTYSLGTLVAEELLQTMTAGARTHTVQAATPSLVVRGSTAPPPTLEP